MAIDVSKENVVFCNLGSGDDEKLEKDEIREMELNMNENSTKKQKLSTNEAKCDSKICILSVVGKVALYLCYFCNTYLCEDCFEDHSTHEYTKVESRESERMRMGEILMGRMRHERVGDLEFNEEHAKVYGKINIKHELDKEDCDIHGICGLKNKRWVVLDYSNYCMKIFNSVTNTLLRYVRFGSDPRDVVEIELKQTQTEFHPDSVYKPNVTGQDKHHLLAVTFPRIKQIWYIDVNKIPAKKVKPIQMTKNCWFIDFSDSKIFTLCKENIGVGSLCTIDILSLEGSQLKVIQLDIPGLFPYIDLAVFKEKVYLTDYHNDKVFCINAENSETIFDLTINGSGPEGICVDTRNNVYLCGFRHNQVYKLSHDLRRYEPLDIDAGFTRRPWRICFNDGKLFVCQSLSSYLCNFIIVIQIT